MLGLESRHVFIASYGFDTTGKEVRWLSSVFAGIIMCHIVYGFTGFISPLLFKGYQKLKNSERLEWNNRGFSTCHAIVVAAGSLYLLIASDLFNEGTHEESIVNRSSTLSDTILGISIGYFLADLAMIIWNFPTLGGVEFLLHHGLSLFSISQSLVSGQAQFYILMVLFSEITTPSVNFRWYLDVAGQKASSFYVYNGVAMFLGWLAARVLLFIYFYYHVYTHFDQVKKIYPLGFYSFLTAPALLAVMNLVWFWKITKGMIKVLSKPKQS